MSDWIFLDSIPDYPPVEKVDVDEKWIKHVHCEGARFHVFTYIFNRSFDRVWATRHCSEPNCIVNKKSDNTP